MPAAASRSVLGHEETAAHGHAVLRLARIPAEAEATFRDLEKSGAGALYSTFDWMVNWQREVGEPQGVEPLFVLAADENGPVAALALGLFRLGPLRICRFLGHGLGNQNSGLWQPEALTEAFATRLPQELTRLVKDAGADMLDLRNIPPSIAGRPHPLHRVASRPSHVPLFAFDLQADFDALYAEKRSSAARKKLRTKEKRLRDAGGFAVLSPDDPADAEKLLQALFRQREARSRQSGVPNAFASPEAQAFLGRMLRQSCQEGNARFMIHALEVAGEIRATYLGGIHGRRYHAYTNSIAEDDLASSSPGDILLLHLVREMCGRGVEVFDFGLGEERYKTAWAEALPLSDLVAPLTPKGRLASIALDGAASLKRGLRENRALWPLLRRLRAAMLRRG
ncbi:GNAT family N-acetyltransferase [Stappia sp. F7233]|uniref:GNAT family N-acetyltransferase n=1 Tax=Stappia albiluteola TaxID=2758565 RepID=A0A839AB42_9HYPH|nr:GNAT family N-acetyltransferase [Stappia albiluteola]MBA5776127.1 GNAT family N-acetyltransferase [Stappia albiluteola]